MRSRTDQWLPAIEEAVKEHAGRSRLPTPPVPKAAVAAILREQRPGAVDLLLIERAKHPDDPWSGHMAFPGGRVSDEDDGPIAAAERESREEIGLDLDRRADRVGDLSPVFAKARGRTIPLVIHPFVYSLREQPRFELNHEVADLLWVPMDFLLDDSNRSTMTYRLAGAKIPLPCYRYDERVIWGLTLRMIDELLDVVRPLRG